MTDSRLDGWVEALIARHAAAFTRPELLKAIRALSARYVESRAGLPRRSPLDSAGKRAAFATFYAPLHFVTTGLVIQALDARLTQVRGILDLGCGTGPASAAWTLACAEPPAIAGVDRDAWTLAEARWNWAMLGLSGRAERGDMVAALARRTVSRRPASSGHVLRGIPARALGVVLAWSVNELDAAPRAALLDAVLRVAAQGPRVLVIEPVARSAAPWWREWAAAIVAAGGRSDEWAFDARLPRPLAALDSGAGFDRPYLKARSLCL